MIIIIILVSVSTAVVEFFVKGTPTVVFYSYAFIVPLIVLVPHVLYATSRRFSERISDGWLLWIDRLVFGVIIINIPGSIYFHEAGIQYDRFIHFGGAFGVFLISIFLFIAFRHSFANKSINIGRILGILFFVLFIGLFLWEGFQFKLDQLLGTRLFFDTAQSIEVDFWEDILFGLLGLITALFYANHSFKKLLSVLK